MAKKKSATQREPVDFTQEAIKAGFVIPHELKGQCDEHANALGFLRNPALSIPLINPNLDLDAETLDAIETSGAKFIGELCFSTTFLEVIFENLSEEKQYALIDALKETYFGIQVYHPASGKTAYSVAIGQADGEVPCDPFENDSFESQEEYQTLIDQKFEQHKKLLREKLQALEDYYALGNFVVMRIALPTSLWGIFEHQKIVNTTKDIACRAFNESARAKLVKHAAPANATTDEDATHKEQSLNLMNDGISSGELTPVYVMAQGLPEASAPEQWAWLKTQFAIVAEEISLSFGIKSQICEFLLKERQFITPAQDGLILAKP